MTQAGILFMNVLTFFRKQASLGKTLASKGSPLNYSYTQHVSTRLLSWAIEGA